MRKTETTSQFSSKQDFANPINQTISQKKHLYFFTTILILSLFYLYSAFAHKTNSPQSTTKTYLITLPKQQQKSTPTLTSIQKPFIPDSPKYFLKKIIIKKGDSLVSLTKPYLKTRKDKQLFFNLIQHYPVLARLHPKQELILSVNKKNNLQQLSFPSSETKRIIIKKKATHFTLNTQHLPVTLKPKLTYVRIQDSLFSSGANASLNDKTISELAHLFSWDIDFALDIRKGDEFIVLFQQRFIQNKQINPGPIIAASFTNQGKTYYAISHKTNNGPNRYYNSLGQSIKKAFIRNPVKYTRISSGFTRARYHPILHRIRAHKGVDYAAPHGTPIKVTGNGRINFIGRKGGYGNTIIVQHNARYSTLYGHLSRFAHPLYKGKRVKQEQIIGYVGSSGLATGPHLHYEFRVNGVHRNPLTVKLPKATQISKKQRPLFFKKSNQYITLLKKFKKSPKTIVLTQQYLSQLELL